MIVDRNQKEKSPKEISWRTLFVEGDYVKSFTSIIGLLKNLSTCEILLLYYLVNEMDNGNIVQNTKKLKESFNKFAARKPYSDTSLNRAFKKLADEKILIRLNQRVRGMYKVNPLYFFRGDNESRIKEIRIDLEARDVNIISRYRAETFDRDKALKQMKEKKKKITK